MKRVKLLSMAAVVALASSTLSADALSDAFKESKVSGELRAAYVGQDNDNPAANSDNVNSAVGGSLGIETKAINGISLGAKFYTTQRLQSKTGDGAGTSLFNATDDGYSILGEAYVNVAHKNTNIRVGRQKIDTPYANDDDIRMIPNLFEAAVLSNTDIADTTLLAAYVTKWAGVDATGKEDFKKLIAGADGTTMLAAIYGGIKDSEISAWYYDVDGLTSIVHAEGSTQMSLSDSESLTLAAQYANFSKKKSSNTDGVAYGLSAELAISDLTLSLAYNATENDTGKSVTNGFGGGPFMTSMDETTIAGLNDAKAYVAGIGYQFMDNFAVSYAYGSFEDGATNGEEYQESDLVVEYGISDDLSALAIYTDLEHKTNNVVQTDSFKRLQAYLNYSF